MQIVNLGEKIDDSVVLCLGFFGCMHKGHTELLQRAKNRAVMTKSKVALFTFSNNHLAVLNRDTSVVYTFDERLSIYNSLGVDYVIAATFDDYFMNLSSKCFLSQINCYNLESVICGFDYSCGKDRLNAFGVRAFFKNIPVYIVEQINVDGQKVSTTLIRQLLTYNQIDKVNRLLSEPFFVLGTVVHGRGVGKTIGFPTANIELPTEKLLPCGVWGGITSIDGAEYRAIINIGNAPTFEVERNTLEVHIINYNGNLYGKKIKIALTKFLRPISKFDSAEKLSMQLQLDKENVLND